MNESDLVTSTHLPPSGRKRSESSRRPTSSSGDDTASKVPNDKATRDTHSSKQRLLRVQIKESDYGVKEAPSKAEPSEEAGRSLIERFVRLVFWLEGKGKATAAGLARMTKGFPGNECTLSNSGLYLSYLHPKGL